MAVDISNQIPELVGKTIGCAWRDETGAVLLGFTDQTTFKFYPASNDTVGIYGNNGEYL